MERYIKHRVMLGDSRIKLGLLTLLVLFAVPTSGWAGFAPPIGACCIPAGEPTECDIGSERFCSAEGGDFQGEGTNCDDNICNLPPTRDINVRVIAICAAPVDVEPHDGGDGEVCICIGPRSTNFNVTGTLRNGNCRRNQAKFCFVDTLVGPLFWKETVRRQSGPTTVLPGDIVEARVRCPEGKMVISCEGGVTVGNTNEPAANTASNIFPTDDDLACRHVARTDEPTGPPGTNPCGAASFPTCAGDCPPGQTCVAVGPTVGCLCAIPF